MKPAEAHDLCRTLALDDDRQVVTHCPRCIERLKRERTLSLERVEHDYLMLTGVDNDQRVNLFDPINRAEIKENKADDHRSEHT